ncbi:MAG: glucose-6-phosphate isomerase [Actinobacteria bacterium]|nr:glucose-6-phosphate isomerase [Actinomycetota bacterium]MCL6105725.1 glucose-6-phosphate isomerase [Actinomycetota bacterium]
MSILLERLLAKDSALWPQPNVSANRLDWIDSPHIMRQQAKDLLSWANTVDAEKIVLLGMGGSSLGPLVLSSSSQTSSRQLIVLDTTDPKTIEEVDFRDAFVVVSSKSGTTLEPNCLMSYALSKISDTSRYVAITDPNTPLAKLSDELRFSRTFLNSPDIGGRYSVLSYFGMVPAALLGIDIAELCERAVDANKEDAVEMGVQMGKAALLGQDKVTIVIPAEFSAFGLWVEQLIAESTGKKGTGLVPVPTTESEVGPDRNVINVEINNLYDLGEQFYRWEIATAVAGHILEIDPFDEPNVAESKENTLRVLESLPLHNIESKDPSCLIGWLKDTAEPAKDYISLQAWLPYGQDNDLLTLRNKIRDLMDGMAVTAAYGPRFLHSTGQLHKGGPNTMVGVEFIPTSQTADLAIPGYPYDFATLIKAQVIGDHQSLVSHGRRVITIAADTLGDVLSKSF